MNHLVWTFELQTCFQRWASCTVADAIRHYQTLLIVHQLRCGTSSFEWTSLSLFLFPDDSILRETLRTMFFGRKFDNVCHPHSVWILEFHLVLFRLRPSWWYDDHRIWSTYMLEQPFFYRHDRHDEHSDVRWKSLQRSSGCSTGAKLHGRRFLKLRAVKHGGMWRKAVERCPITGVLSPDAYVNDWHGLDDDLARSLESVAMLSMLSKQCLFRLESLKRACTLNIVSLTVRL